MMFEFKPHITVNPQGNLALGGVDLVKLADRYSTPLYVYDEQRIRQRYRELKKAIEKYYGDVEVFYACKANTNLAILHILRQEKAGVDILSEGELYLALLAGIRPEKIIFTGNNKTDRELEKALKAGVTINLDSLHELDRLIRITEREKLRARVSFRVNPEVSPETHPYLSTGLKESKFGIHENVILDGYKKAKEAEFLDIVGIHMHIGSQITKTSPYEVATARLFDIIGRIKNNLGIELEFADLGGGVGIEYKEAQEIITPEDLAKAVVPVINEKIKEYSLKKPELIFEPGRFIVGDAGIMLTRVSTVKSTPYKKFIGCDSGFHVLLRPVIYSAYHEVIVANKPDEKPQEIVDIAGNVCESGDILARDRKLPVIEEGDVLAFLDSGAYGFIMASQYNSRPRPAEVLVSQEGAELIRQVEDFSSLIEKQLIPERLMKE